MADQRQPDYDFFGPGHAPQQPTPRPQHPYGVPPHQQTLPAQPAQQPYGVPPSRGPAPGGLPPAPYVVPRRSRAVTALIVAAIVVGSLVVAGIVAAIAIPVFLNQRVRAEWKATTVTLPRTFEGGQLTAAPPDLQPQTPEGTAMMDVGTYRTDTGVTLFVLAAKTGDPLTVEDQAEARRSLLAGLASEGMNLQEQDAGDLGGWLGCGRVGAAPSTACVATDHGSLVAVIVTGAADPVTVARRLREATVHH
jgi:hypothetical protein